MTPSTTPTPVTTRGARRNALAHRADEATITAYLRELSGAPSGRPARPATRRVEAQRSRCTAARASIQG
ncbi:hypothetical protein GKE82_08180 [Conexibacter sp. W3-3-2]|uniref:Uncharacterized protein n=1 Tax=Paraconexibacter algicola TaxID=2133960 RepID=A0A2T4UBU0_9ACTN|nr:MULTISPECIES: hypothetical protein [Solirubrobacterales]MTD44275.1 hypothetical protein [Conexibacter sp. W3-3-2]PTL54358.1 hypothetical protein C7Y72_21735 [Paraconexibacter algicola]